ncbi:hypothetical protein GWK47_025026 [Chionoecetes opilio]|uniref:Uncharacterized protein n=1 Tax=Chionoecetes opilio TaxID=41210 RepID=A0A8J4XL37_CHIOP|nr:hypothetical protein GWK47_025026 [Chionoecetes opilio]
MRLYGSLAVRVVVMVMVIAWAHLIASKPDFHLRLKRFHFYGCKANGVSTLRNVNLSFLSRHNFLAGVSGTSRSTAKLLTSSSPPCTLPSNVLFRSLPSTKDEQLTIMFHQAVFEDNPEQTPGNGSKSRESGEEAGGQGNNTTQQLRDDQDADDAETNPQQNVTCTFKVDDKLSLQSGYGFISCQVDAAAGAMWRAWREAATVKEEEAAHGRLKTIIGVAAGSFVAVVVIVSCVMYRLRSGPASYQHGRRPSTLSIRTASTGHT